MKPFQAMYFVRHNLSKVMTVFIMIALTGLLYVGGSYISNIEVEYLKTYEPEKDVAFVNLNGMSTEQGKDAFLEEVRRDESLQLIPVGVNGFQFPTVLAFINGNSSFCYSKEDFLWRNQRMGWVEDSSLVEENTLFVSERYATYLGVKEGDLYSDNSEKLSLYFGEGPYEVHIMEGDGFGNILISNECLTNEYYQLTWSDKGSREVFESRVAELKEKYKEIDINTHAERVKRARENFEINAVIFLSIMVVVTCVFFITINAVLVGIYDKRKSEFQIYESIGIPKSKIRRKVVGELVIMSAVGMVLGLALAMGMITLLNVCIFAKDGLQLYYYHPWALGSWLICNAMILIPSILLRLRAIHKSSGEV
ncbi:MAG: ABC transporter permease [Lachnospiraceae bacterium]|nr:ABC transporter permease [Lachnospiraceae bacterium]